MSDDRSQVRVLFVCMGNICRSPTAHAVFEQRVRAAGLEHRIGIDSAGTHGYHVGSPPDPRAEAAGRSRGYDLSGLRARRVTEADLARHEYVIAMDTENLRVLEALAGSPGGAAELRLLLDYVDDAPTRDVPDPYYGARNGFEEVLDLVEAGADALLARLRARHDL